MKFFLAITATLLTSLCFAQTDSAKLSAPGFQAAISKQTVQLLDVRTAGEFNSGHITHAMQADWNNQTEFLERIQYVDKTQPVYVYCLAGGRSNVAANWMRTNGFANVVELTGGINAWKAAGQPLEGNSPVPQMTIEQYWASIPSDKTVLVDFGASWCPPCLKMKPVIEDLQATNHINVINIDGGIHTNVMQSLHLEPIPVFIIYKNGKEKWRKQGVVSREELLNELK